MDHAHRAQTLDRLEATIEQAKRSDIRRRRIRSAIDPIAVLLAVVVGWDLVTRFTSLPAYLVPSPFAVWQSATENWADLLYHAQVTSLEIALGFIASVVIGTGLGVVIFLSPMLSRSVYPLLVASQAVPKTAIAPLFVIWFGFGILPKVLIAFLIAFFPIVISTVVGLTSIEAGKIRLAQSMGLGGWRTFTKIRLPQAGPSIFGGLKVAITLCVVGAVVGEFVGASSGLGYLLLVANGSLDSALLFADLFLLTAIGVGGFLLVEIAERVAIPWHRGTDENALVRTM